jgi:hypothetical protein
LGVSAETVYFSGMIGRAPVLVLLAFGLGVLPSMISCKKEEPAPTAAPAADDDEKPKKKKKKVEDEEEEAPTPSASPAPAASSAPPDAGTTATVKKPATTATGTGTLAKTDAGTMPPPLFTIPTNIIPSGLPPIPTFPPPQ